ncbi:hypothetical protein [Nostoc favosum]|uniref:Orphan protein n=1 Tax=Nostoc favosum CHAB5714 TaxID=2780399 RepID=A0ABS8IHQ5_9NOSO|nr:hypothetical protein [Nostoc favosum]MCC5603803.1 hypothetical protein [Nostoc favosum CHAB5714]
MKLKLQKLLVSIILSSTFPITCLSFTSTANAEIEIPDVYVPEADVHLNGNMALSLCSQYTNRASANPNNLQLQHIALKCQSITLQYASCIIQSNPYQLLKCVERPAQSLEWLLQYTDYLQ